MKFVGAYYNIFWMVLLVGIELQIATAYPVEVAKSTFTVSDLIGISKKLDTVQQWCNRSSDLLTSCIKYTSTETTRQVDCSEKVQSLFNAEITSKTGTNVSISIPEDVFKNLRCKFDCNTSDKGFFFILTNDTLKDKVLFIYPKLGTTASPVTENIDISSEKTTPSLVVVPTTDFDSVHQSDHTEVPATKAQETTGIFANGDEDNHLKWIIPLAIVILVIVGLVIAFIVHRLVKRAGSAKHNGEYGDIGIGNSTEATDDV